MNGPHLLRSWLADGARRAAALIALPAERREGPAHWLRRGRQRPPPAAGACSDVEVFAGVQCFGLLPEAPAGAPSAAGIQAPASPLAMAFRNIRSAVLESRPEVRVIALTSALPGDGKTTCSVGLARQSALEGFKTVLVDCDLRRRSSSAELPRPPAVGLLEVIRGECSLDEALASDGLSPLCILPVAEDLEAIARATNRDVFATDGMLELMSELRRRFDYVYLDTPPLLALVDARRLAPQADAFLLLARWRTTPKEAVRNAIDLLNSAEASLAGVVLTRAAVPAEPAPA